MDTWEQLEPLYENFDGLVRSIRRTAGGDAEDIVQTAFLKLKERLDAGYEARNLKGLLERTIRNDLREYKRYQAVREDARDEGRAIAQHPPLGTIAAHELALTVDAELNAMPERHARAFVATELQGASSTEAAQALGSTPGAVREGACMARKRLRKALA